MGIKQDIVVKNSFSQQNHAGYGSTPGNYLADYVTRDEAAESYEPGEVLSEDHTHDLNTTNKITYQIVPGRSFGNDGLTYDAQKASDVSEMMQQHYDRGGSVQRMVLSLSSDALLKHYGLLRKNFHHQVKGDYWKQIDELKLRQCVASGMDQLAKQGHYQNLVWIASTHVNTNHIHIHIVMCDHQPGGLRVRAKDGEQRGKLNAKEKDAIRSGFLTRVQELDALKPENYTKQLSKAKAVYPSFEEPPLPDESMMPPDNEAGVSDAELNELDQQSVEQTETLNNMSSVPVEEPPLPDDAPPILGEEPPLPSENEAIPSDAELNDVLNDSPTSHKTNKKAKQIVDHNTRNLLPRRSGQSGEYTVKDYCKLEPAFVKLEKEYARDINPKELRKEYYRRYQASFVRADYLQHYVKSTHSQYVYRFVRMEQAYQMKNADRYRRYFGHPDAIKIRHSDKIDDDTLRYYAWRNGNLSRKDYWDTELTRSDHLINYAKEIKADDYHCDVVGQNALPKLSVNSIINSKEVQLKRLQMSSQMLKHSANHKSATYMLAAQTFKDSQRALDILNNVQNEAFKARRRQLQLQHDDFVDYGLNTFGQSQSDKDHGFEK